VPRLLARCAPLYAIIGWRRRVICMPRKLAQAVCSCQRLLPFARQSAPVLAGFFLFSRAEVVHPRPHGQGGTTRLRRVPPPCPQVPSRRGAYGVTRCARPIWTYVPLNPETQTAGTAQAIPCKTAFQTREVHKPYRAHALRGLIDHQGGRPAAARRRFMPLWGHQKPAKIIDKGEMAEPCWTRVCGGGCGHSLCPGVRTQAVSGVCPDN
jgi:hypothetical protein